ncbi:hypothetical protein [Listeria grandensis]|uniref:hypothetical protein n=1 Tax=Listeria grandensis TaxID=1494963 RepID=UPI00164E4A9A|nr:hypothetical protein [Listeria grandensis]MBC6314055.1 hypothetical protein [Listeria grandensis]
MQDQLVFKRWDGKAVSPSWKEEISKYVPQVAPIATFITNEKTVNKGKGEWVSFPTNKQAMQDAWERLDIQQPSDCICLCVTSTIEGLAERISARIDLDVLNTLAEEVHGLDGSPKNKAIFEACLEVFQANDITDILNMVVNTDCFQLEQNQKQMQNLANQYQDKLGMPKSLNKSIHAEMQGVPNPIPKPTGKVYMSRNGFLEQLRMPRQYFTSPADMPEKYRVLPASDGLGKKSVLDDIKKEVPTQTKSKEKKPNLER